MIAGGSRFLESNCPRSQALHEGSRGASGRPQAWQCRVPRHRTGSKAGADRAVELAHLPPLLGAKLIDSISEQTLVDLAKEQAERFPCNRGTRRSYGRGKGRPLRLARTGIYTAGGLSRSMTISSV